MINVRSSQIHVKKTKKVSLTISNFLAVATMLFLSAISMPNLQKKIY